MYGVPGPGPSTGGEVSLVCLLACDTYNSNLYLRHSNLNLNSLFFSRRSLRPLYYRKKIFSPSKFILKKVSASLFSFEKSSPSSLSMIPASNFILKTTRRYLYDKYVFTSRYILIYEVARPGYPINFDPFKERGQRLFSGNFSKNSGDDKWIWKKWCMFRWILLAPLFLKLSKQNQRYLW